MIVDVLIPAYNVAATLVDAVRSIQNQSISGIRIIVVNDGSTDTTGQLLDEIASKDPRVLAIHTANQGIVGALNTALGVSDAPFIARHDGDDLAFPERFAKQLAYLDAHPDCVAVAGNAWHIDANGARLGSRSNFVGDVQPDAAAIPSLEPYLMHPFLMVRQEVLVAVGGYRYALHAEDTDLYWRLFERGRLHNMADIMGEYRIHTGSVTGKSVHNGRVSAIYSQLAALSHQRRVVGNEDISFTAETISATQRLHSLTELVEYAAAALTEEEGAYLRVAASAKLLDNITYRPYLPDRADCAFIRNSFRRDGHLLTATDRASLRWREMIVVSKLVGARRWRELAALRPAPGVWRGLLAASIQRRSFA